MTDLTHLTIAAALDGLAAKKFSARELADAHIAKMAALKKLNAYITETADVALLMADASDKRIAAGNAGALRLHREDTDEVLHQRRACGGAGDV